MLNISIVLYNPDWEQIRSRVAELLQAECLHTIYLIDNSACRSDIENGAKLCYYWNESKNLGYGSAHNIAIRNSIYDGIDYHLILDSNIQVLATDIDRLYVFMQKNPTVGILAPQLIATDGSVYSNCHLLPSLFGMMRGKRSIVKRDLIDKMGCDRMLNAPYLDCCCLMMRTKAVHAAGLFDEQYLYRMADIDLCRQVHRNNLTIYLPDIRAVRFSQQCRNKVSAFSYIADCWRYFCKWGWLFDKERLLINHMALSQYDMLGGDGG